MKVPNAFDQVKRNGRGPSEAYVDSRVEKQIVSVFGKAQSISYLLITLYHKRMVIAIK
nr:hypothetical protein [Gracilibacillus suaedae]